MTESTEPPASSPSLTDMISIYHGFVASSQLVEARRAKASEFFVAINLAAVGAVGFLLKEVSSLGAGVGIAGIAIAGCLLCALWRRILLSYTQLNRGKFLVIHRIEGALPLKPYQEEWRELGSGDDPMLYQPISNLESRIPLAFAALHIGATVVTAVIYFNQAFLPG